LIIYYFFNTPLKLVGEDHGGGGSEGRGEERENDRTGGELF